MKQELKHTPGPWLLLCTAEHGCHLDVCGTGGRIGQTTLAGRIARVDYIPASWGDADANARLIASSPDLLAALGEIAEGKGAYSRDPLVHATNTIEAMKGIARSAIAKAKGGAS